MHILLTGASGFIGQHLLLDLLAQGHRVTACCRHPEKILIDSPQLQRLAIDFSLATQISDWLPHLLGIDTLINSVGIIAESDRQSFQTLHTNAPIALFQAAAQMGCKRIIQISALGADAQATSAYHLSKQTADEALRDLDLDWFILQPSIVYGDGARSSGFLHALAALPVHILPDGGGQLLQPIHIDDVLTTIRGCLDSAVVGRLTLPLVGPQAISYADYLQKLRPRLGLAPATQLAIPYRYTVSA